MSPASADHAAPARSRPAGLPKVARFLLGFRALAILVFAALGVCGLLLFGWPISLCVVLFVMAAYILAETVLLAGWASGSDFEVSPDAQGSPYKEIVKVTITTQGVVLGLVAFQEGPLPNATLKLGACSLVAGILVAGAFLQNVAFGEPGDELSRFAASLLFSLTFWALGFGLLCVVAGSW